MNFAEQAYMRELGLLPDIRAAATDGESADDAVADPEDDEDEEDAEAMGAFLSWCKAAGCDPSTMSAEALVAVGKVYATLHPNAPSVPLDRVPAPATAAAKFVGWCRAVAIDPTSLYASTMAAAKALYGATTGGSLDFDDDEHPELAYIERPDNQSENRITARTLEKEGNAFAARTDRQQRYATLADIAAAVNRTPWQIAGHGADPRATVNMAKVPAMISAASTAANIF